MEKKRRKERDKRESDKIEIEKRWTLAVEKFVKNSYKPFWYGFNG